MTKTFLFLCLLFIFGCASNEEKPTEKRYSDDTNRAFEMIERGGSYYLKKAPEQSVPTPQIASRPAPKRVIVESRSPREEIGNVNEITRPATPTPAPVQQTPTNTKVSERLIEINQNLAFYCMKYRKDAPFKGDEAKCMKFVNKTMENCQKQHRIVNSKLLNCIQKKLKR